MSKKEEKNTRTEVTEENISETENAEMVKTPTEILKKPFEKSLTKIEHKAKKANFMEDIYLDLPPEYHSPSKNKDMIEIGNSAFVYCKTTKARTFQFNKRANYIVTEALETIKKFNNKSGKPDEIYYSITAVTDKGDVIRNIEIRGKAKFNADSFQEALSFANNYLQTVFKNTSEFKTYLETLVLSKINKTLIIYENSGLLEPQKFLGADFLIDKGVIYYADDEGKIPTADPSVFVMANDNRPYLLPRISKSTKTADIVCKDFLVNTRECFGKNSISALLSIGHIITGLFFRQFLDKKIGVPLLIICGVSSSGKTTLTQCGISIFGMSDDFLIAGDSTTNGQQYIAQSINNVACPVDDVYDAVLKSGRFAAKTKANYRGTPRVRMRAHGQEPDLIQICSQVIYTANGAIPEVQEIENRANVITLMDTSFDVDNYNYLDENTENREELSLLLPELLKYSPDEVIDIHYSLKESLKSAFDTKINNRVLSNVAYMWTGLTLLQDIAHTSLDGIDDEIISYTKEVVEHYKKLPTPIDQFLTGLLIMKNMGVIEKGKHYAVKEFYETDDESVRLIFHKDTLLTAYNNFFAKENDRRIEKSIFDRHLAIDKRVIKNNFSHRYKKEDGKKGKNTSSIVLNITEWEDVEDFTGTHLIGTSYSKAKALVEECNNP